ncbi:hypothetical protein HK102_010409 [Quaeritorhiza haematococci]|nr:hypothetical protein HK102_010409 [Quaeritorhiza haematococci]
MVGIVVEKKEKKSKKVKKEKKEKKNKDNGHSKSLEATDNDTPTPMDTETVETPTSPASPATENVSGKKRKRKDKEAEKADNIKEEKEEKKEKKEKKKKKKQKKGEEETEETAAVPAVEEKMATKETPKAQQPISDAASDDNVWVYKQHPDLASLPESQITSFLSESNISIEPEATGESSESSSASELSSMRPILEFRFAQFPQALADLLAAAAFTKPTPIQATTWPFLLQKRDLVGIAATGSGKTLSFALPALIHVQNKKQQSSSNKKDKKKKKQYNSTVSPTVLVLAPTRELAMQTQDTFTRFGEPLGITSVCLVGGVSKNDQKQALRQAESLDAIVATPGRLLDFVSDAEGGYQSGPTVDLSQVSYFVLDEADRMLDLGFEPHVKKIAGLLKAKEERQTVMFSATWPASIQRLSSTYMRTPFVRVTVGSKDLSANVNITQTVEVIDPMAKDRRLSEVLRDYYKKTKNSGNSKALNRVIVFALYKKECARVHQVLQRQGYKDAQCIHGDMPQHQRTANMNAFKEGKCQLLVATDVAARGLDIPDVQLVVNYTYPLTTEEYCHRIGRTARAGKSGLAHTFFTVHDKKESGALINVLKQAGQVVPADLMKFGTTVKKKLDPTYGAFTKEVDMSKKSTKIVFDDDE